MGIRVVTKEGYEADDALATMARLGREAGADVEVMTGDKDSFQLATDAVTILYPKRGVSDLVRMTPAAIEEKYAVTPANYRGLAALVGEKADNLPVCPEWGTRPPRSGSTPTATCPASSPMPTRSAGRSGRSCAITSATSNATTGSTVSSTMSTSA